MRRRHREETEVDWIRKRARRLSDAERSVARFESPYNKRIVAVRHYHNVRYEVRRDAQGGLHLFVVDPGHLVPRYVRMVRIQPSGLRPV